MSFALRLSSIGLAKFLPQFHDEGYDDWDLLLTLHERQLFDATRHCKMDSENASRFVEYVLKFAGPLAASEILIDEPLGRTAAASLAVPPPRLAIASMMKRPCNVVRWLRHHRDRCGVACFFLRVEETPELQELFATPEWRDCVHATFAHGATIRDCGGEQCVRQDLHVAWAIQAAREFGCTHLMHCDDDELFYAPNGKASLHAFLQNPGMPNVVGGGVGGNTSDGGGAGAGRGGTNVIELHARVLEAYYPTAESDDPFACARAFRHRPAECARYGWQRGSTGKSIGVLAVPGLQPAGPHHFGERSGDAEARDGAFELAATVVMPPSVCVLLHYEGSSLSRWLGKYTEQNRYWRARRAAHPPPIVHVATPKDDESEDGWADAYFSSCNAAAGAIVDAEEASAAGSTAAAADAIARAREGAEVVWASWKLEPPGVREELKGGERHRVLRERGITLIDIAWSDGESARPTAVDEASCRRRRTVGAKMRQRLLEDRQAIKSNQDRLAQSIKS